MIFRLEYEPGLAQASYIVGCPGSREALIVDPRRDVRVFIDRCEAEGLRIVAVVETHIHADFLSGARELAARTGARLLLSAEGGPDWLYRGVDEARVRWLRHGDSVRYGSVHVEAVHTPGHTPEHLGFLIRDGARSEEPMLFLSGDFVFVGDVGRPDLLEKVAARAGTAEPAARTMFRSLRDRFMPLADHVLVWPAHGAGSACGRALGGVPASSVGYERRSSWWIPFVERGDEDGFVRRLLEGQPESPPYFGRMKVLNRDGMPPFRAGRPPRVESPIEGAIVVDTRDRQAFAAGHARGSLSLPAGRSLSTWAGWLVDADRPMQLVANEEDLDEIVAALARVGLDEVAGYVTAPTTLGVKQELPVIDVQEAGRRWKAGEVRLLDVRSDAEYDEAHVPGALHVFAGRVLDQLDAIPRDRPLAVHCGTGFRSSIAAAALHAGGVDAVMNVEGGFSAWRQAGLPVEER